MIRYHEKCNLPLPININASIDDGNTETSHANNAKINNPTAKEPANACSVNDVIEKLTNQSFDNENNWSYQVHWYDQENSHDTWEPLGNLPRNEIVSYHKRKRIPLPPSINHALNGLAKVTISLKIHSGTTEC